VSDSAYEYDVQERSPNTEKAARVLGFHATTSLSDGLDEIIPWIAEQIEVGRI
jgi:nucleoside-diphosphate-sugar epimerase